MLKNNTLRLLCLACTIFFAAIPAVSQHNNTEDAVDIYPVEIDGRYGYEDSSGKLVIEAKFKRASPFNEYGIAFVRCDESDNPEYTGKNALIDRQGDFVSEPYDTMRGRDRDQIIVYRNNKGGYIDQKGDVVLPLIYDRVQLFSSGLAYVEFKRTRAFIDVKGNVIINLSEKKWYYKYSFHHGFAGVKVKGKYGIINTSGELVFKSPAYIYPVADDAQDRGFFRLSLNRRIIVDSNGNLTVPNMFDRFGSISEGLVTFKMWDKWGVMNLDQRILVMPIYEQLKEFSEGLCAFKKNGLWGYLDRHGSEIVPAMYDYAISFSKGYATVQKDSKWHYIDTQGLFCERPSGKIDFSQFKNLIKPEGDFKYRSYMSDDGYAIVTKELSYYRNNKIYAYLSKDFQLLHHPYSIDKGDITMERLPRYAYVMDWSDVGDTGKQGYSNLIENPDVIVIDKKLTEEGPICLILNRDGDQYWIAEENIEYIL